jgi:aryl-alcohol dehydrogenase-like predicted oxidoreductase
MITVNYRVLGRTKFPISEIGYGAWGIGGIQWLGGRDDDSVAALRRAIELGLNFIDTALAYGDGHSERLVGQVVRSTPQKIFVATKVPPKNRVWPARAGTSIQEVFPYDYIIESTETSLRNLGVETIDLQQLHVWSDEWLQRDEWRRAFEDLKGSGKVQAVGISVTEHDPDSALGVAGSGLVDSVQVIYNIFDQSAERRLFPLCAKLDVGVLARVPLDEGGLTGRVDESSVFESGDFRAWYFRGDRKRQVAERITHLRSDLGDGDLPSTALRFCLSHPAVSSVIPGMRSRRHAEANCATSGHPLAEETIEILRRHAWDRNFYQ